MFVQHRTIIAIAFVEEAFFERIFHSVRAFKDEEVPRFHQLLLTIGFQQSLNSLPHEQIKAAIQGEAGKNQKAAMFHFQVLNNADALRGIDPIGFCEEVSMPKTSATEFRKMIALARLMKERA